MRVSVVVCTYAPSMYDAFVEAAESVLAQTYDDVELVVVVDGNDDLYKRVRDEYGDRENVVTHCNAENRGLSVSRNNGVELASGDVVAFMDDDAVADPEWVAELVAVYEEHDVFAAGGPMTPEWVAGKPDFLPAEFYWLVGVTHRGFAEGPGEVRNTFGSNMSFRKEVFEELGGFDPEFGRKGEKNLQAEETVFCVQLRQRFGEGIYYTPDARVAHKVFDYRTDPKWLLERAFWQGYSKRALDELLPDIGSSNESEFLERLVLEFAPERLAELVRDPSWPRLQQLVMLVAFTVAVGAGYVWGLIDW